MSNPAKRLQALREEMAARGIDAYLIPTADFHDSEYVGPHFACRAWVSGFTGSAGTLLVFPHWAGLWTDGRYFLQAEEQLAGSGIRLMKMEEPGVPTVEDFLKSSLQPGQTLGFDGRCVTAQNAKTYFSLVKEKGGRIRDREDLVGAVWYDRPPLAHGPVTALALEYAGEGREDKLARVRGALVKEGADCLLLTSLEDIAWLLNLRGSDIPCTPVFLAYLALEREGGTLFAQGMPPEILEALEADGLRLRPYEGIYDYANRLEPGKKVLLDTRRVNVRLYTSIPTGVTVLDRPSPTEAMKAVKNPVEAENFQKAHLADGIALTRFMYWIKTRAGKEPITERSAAERLEALRREQPDYLMPSFEPIMGFGPHGAIIHYSATEESDAAITSQGFLLADTGGHYRCGTTDCTRTYALGPLTAEEKSHYTAVLQGNLALGAAKFRAGTTGTALDILARQPLWELGLNYNHGTGHGVGYILGVHEGPQSISSRKRGKDPALVPGMVTSNEPGFYREGFYGIRLENLTLCRQEETTPWGTFYAFTTLTLTPYDLDAIDPALLSPREKTLLNDYHARVLAEIGPHLPPEEADWLREAARPVE